MDDWVILCYFGKIIIKKILLFWKNKRGITEPQNGLEYHPGLERKTKKQNKTNHIAVIPEGQQGVAAGHSPGEEHLQTSQVLVLPTGYDVGQSHLQLHVWLHSVDSMDSSHYWTPGQITRTSGLHSVLCAEILWWWVGKNPKGFFSTRKLNFKPATCFTHNTYKLLNNPSHLSVLHTSVSPSHGHLFPKPKSADLFNLSSPRNLFGALWSSLEHSPVQR